ncbi:MAG: MFS transporter [Sedimentisphaerales bacterium]|nr:MFS transporter [Sedimentisphaerales bacterium]
MNIFEKLWNNRTKLWIVLAMISLYFFSYFQRVAIPGTIFDELQTAFGASAASITLLGALTIYVYASTQLFVGIILDRFGAARVLLAGAAVMTVGSILFPLSHSLAALYAMRILVGLGASFIFLSIVKEIDELFDERHFAMILSIAIFLGYFGGVAGTFPFERAVNAFGWRTSLLAAGVVCGIALLWAWRLLHKAQRTGGRDKGFSMTALLEILRNRHIIPVSCAGPVAFGIYFLFQAGIGKKLLQDCGGFSSAAAASCTLMMIAVNMTGIGCSGFLSRLAGNRRKPFLLTATLLAFLSTGCIILILWQKLDTRWLVPCYAMLAGAGSFVPIYCATMKELNHPDSAGTAIGLLNGIAYLFIAIAMNLAGVVMDGFKSQAVITAKAVIYPPAAYIAILTGCFILAAISVAAALRIRETFGKSVYGDTTAGQP